MFEKGSFLVFKSMKTEVWLNTFIPSNLEIALNGLRARRDLNAFKLGLPNSDASEICKRKSSNV